MKVSNPFVTSGYKGAKYFCDREKEVVAMLDAVQNERNFTLFSHRRMGKSLLIQHVLAKLERKGYLCLYVDIYSTGNLKQFVQKMAEAIGSAKLKNKESIILRILKSLGASLSFDRLTGLPSLDFKFVSNEQVYKNLGEIFSLLQNQGKKVVIAIDEFQEVINYSDEFNIEAEIRSVTQAFPEMVFLFSGSQKHLMLDMFSNSRRPFFQSTQMMGLNEIPEQAFRKFINSTFKQRNIEVDDEVIGRLLSDTLLHTYYTQFLLNRMYGSNAGVISEELYSTVFNAVIQEQESLAHSYRNLLTKQQWGLLVAIATETYVTEPYGQTFLRKYDLPAASSVARSLRSLKGDDLVIDCGDMGLRIYDVFLMRYLQQLSRGFK